MVINFDSVLNKIKKSLFGSKNTNNKIVSIKNEVLDAGLLSVEEELRIRNLERFVSGNTKLFGKEFHFSDNLGFLHSLQEIFIDSAYNFQTTKDRPFIVDAGSNIGLSILYFKQLYPNSKIIGFEPDPNIFKLLKINVASYDLDDVVLVNSAVWTEDAELEFYSEGSLAGSSEVDYNNNNEKIIVKAESLRKFIADKHVDLLKFDIEGAENSVLFEIKAELKNVDFLFVEYHSVFNKDQKLGDILKLFQDLGFRYHIKFATEKVKFPFIERVSSGFDLQLNIYCFKA